LKTILNFLLEYTDDLFDMYQHYSDVEYNVFNDIKNHRTPTFRKINPDQYHRALKEFMEHGTFLRFPTKYIFDWKERLLDGIFLLNALTDINGHSSQFPSDEFIDAMFDEDDPRRDERWDFNEASEYLEETGMDDYLPRFSNGHYVMSDYGLSPLLKLADELYLKNKPEEIIVTINKILDVSHQRSDLAELFIEGGSKSLDYISNN
jgi:hypothetical protein